MKNTPDTLQKKKWAAGLLAGACLASALLLLLSFDEHRARYIQPGVADSMLVQEFQTFNLQADKISSREIQADTTFTRRSYHVQLPLDLSQTYFHMSLASSLQPYGMDTWATVDVPGNTMVVHVLQNETLIRSLHLSNDPNYFRVFNYGTILPYFDRPPSREMRDRLQRFDPALPVVLRLQDPSRADDYVEQMADYPGDLLFWLTSEAATNHDRFLQQALTVDQLVRRPELLYFPSSMDTPDQAFHDTLERRNITLHAVDEALRVTGEDGRFGFRQDMSHFNRRLRRENRPVALVDASEQTIGWLEEEIYELKKGGFQFSSLSP